MLSFYHVGLAVPDLDESMGLLNELFGLRWREIREELLEVLDEHDQVQRFTTRRTYSVGGPPAIEVIQQLPGTPFAAAHSTAVHHLGFWTDELAAQSVRLSEMGWQRVGTSAGGNGQPARFALHRSPVGTLIELIDSNFDRPWVCDLFPKNSPNYRPTADQ